MGPHTHVPVVDGVLRAVHIHIMPPVTLYRFRIDVSLVERDLYESLDFRAALHPSENEDYLLSRVIAYALNYEDGLEFSKGLCDPDEPAVKKMSAGGELELAIEIGNPSARRLHKVSKAARRVVVFTYKDPENILRECAGEKVHRAADIEITAVDPKFLGRLTEHLGRDNHWTLLLNEGELTITVGEDSLSTVLRSVRLPCL